MGLCGGRGVHMDLETTLIVPSTISSVALNHGREVKVGRFDS